MQKAAVASPAAGQSAAPTAHELQQRVVPGRPFKPGSEWTGNAAGRAVGSRNKLSTDYLDAI